jgi:hypothetical protein
MTSPEVLRSSYEGPSEATPGGSGGSSPRNIRFPSSNSSPRELCQTSCNLTKARAKRHQGGLGGSPPRNKFDFHHPIARQATPGGSGGHPPGTSDFNHPIAREEASSPSVYERPCQKGPITQIGILQTTVGLGDQNIPF